MYDDIDDRSKCKRKVLPGLGRELSPTYSPGKDSKRNRVDEINELSKASLAAINKKFGNPNAVKRPLVVGKDLELLDY